MRAILEAGLSKRIDAQVVAKLLAYHEGARRALLVHDWEKVGVNAGKFCEMALAACMQLATGASVDLNNIKFDKLATDLMALPKATPEDEAIRLVIPRVAVGAYALRNKRGSAHAKLIEPHQLDATFLVNACDWMLAELIRLFHAGDPPQVADIVRRLVDRRLPIVETIRGRPVLLDTDLSTPSQVLVLLYQAPQQTLTRAELGAAVKNGSSNAISVALTKLCQQSLVHRDGDELVLTSKGAKQVEEKVLAGFDS